MNEVILNRRSIRKYKPDAVPEWMIQEILRAGSLAPSSKNRQPWRFIVATGESKEELLNVFAAGIEREEKQPLLPGSAPYLAGARQTVKIMRQSPAVILVMNALALGFERTLTAEERIYEICNAQSIGAAIENMTLMSEELGLGSLWICDTYFAQTELQAWAKGPGELIAALAVGYKDENPNPRPRLSMDDIVEWRR